MTSGTKKTLIVLVLVVMGFIGWGVYDNRERPLGEGFEYLGKEMAANPWLFFMGSQRYEYNYYYGTDFGEEEVVKRLKKVNIQPDYIDYTATAQGNVKTIHYSHRDSYGSILIYTKDQMTSGYAFLKEHRKKNVIQISHRGYTLLK